MNVWGGGEGCVDGWSGLDLVDELTSRLLP